MFTVAQRDAVRERLLRLAEGDERVVAAAAVGSLAVTVMSRVAGFVTQGPRRTRSVLAATRANDV